jgi:glycerophosphoryl diester phosphodiesterase
MPHSFDLQGHRGARGLRPENTLPSFEAALDQLVTSIETDVVRTQDGELALSHDREISLLKCRPSGTAMVGSGTAGPSIDSLSLNELRCWIADGNPDPMQFSTQSPAILPLSGWFADVNGLHPYGVPTLADLFRFVAAYAGEDGAALGKTDEQRANAARVSIDVELKRLPFVESEVDARRTEEALVLLLASTGWADRCRARSFDHRTIRRLCIAEPRLTGGVLIANTTPIRPAVLALDAGATIYCPDYRFLDAEQVRDARAAGLRVIPWTVNDINDWARLLEWGVDGITTDYPDQLARFLSVSEQSTG